MTKLEGSRMSVEIEIDESYFCGKRKGKRVRGALGKSVVFGLWKRDARVYTRVVQQVSDQELMAHIRTHTRKGSMYYADTFRSYNSLKRLVSIIVSITAKHLPIARVTNLNGIEGFWSYAKHILYNYRGVSKYHFPMYLKEVEFRFNHRNENFFKQFLSIYFSYVSH